METLPDDGPDSDPQERARSAGHSRRDQRQRESCCEGIEPAPDCQGARPQSGDDCAIRAVNYHTGHGTDQERHQIARRNQQARLPC